MKLHNSWIIEQRKQEVRDLFEPKYHRKLSDEEISTIAENLANLAEIVLKLKYENQQK